MDKWIPKRNRDTLFIVNLISCDLIFYIPVSPVDCCVFPTVQVFMTEAKLEFQKKWEASTQVSYLPLLMHCGLRPLQAISTLHVVK